MVCGIVWCAVVCCGVVWFGVLKHGRVWFGTRAWLLSKGDLNPIKKHGEQTYNDPLFYEKIKAALLSKVLLRRRLLCLNLLLAANLFLLLCVRGQELRGDCEPQPPLHRFTA